MDQIHIEDNDKRFTVLLKTLDICDEILDKLNDVEQINSTLNDQYIVSLISNASEANLSLSTSVLRGSDYKALLEQASELESIVNLGHRLDECLDDPERFSEAIDHLEQIELLHKHYGHQVPIIEQIYRNSKKQRDYLISNLCDRLEHTKYSSEDEVITIVNYLARCWNFTDRELRLKYLQARDNWFNNACEKKSGSFDDVVAVHCQGLPMIFKEYKNLFSESGRIRYSNLVQISSDDQAKEDGAIINSWLLLKISIFITSLEVYLKTIRQSSVQTPTMLSDTMKKCFELTGWLSSIGFDFSSQLRPLFHRALMEEVKASINGATDRFESSFTTIISKSIESLLLPVDDEILRISNMRPEEQLPKSIEHYPIFRVYCLYIIDSLRWLQAAKSILSVISLSLGTYAALNASVTRITKALALILNTDNNASHPILSKIAISFITEILPFLANYCERLFPEKVILSAIGLSKAEYKSINASEPEKLTNFRLNLKQIAEPLRRIMPTLLQTIDD